ncbi:MAG: hypothetical protein E6Q99_02790 [Elusimicrobia bacterium]|nr:MAG: hypothetical protein E6Q99_02790 [Elusimicrobiota bacterium]
MGSLPVTETAEDALYRSAMDRALYWLKFRARAAKEMAARLAEKGFPPPVVDRVVARLAELKLLDDAALARGLTEAHRRAGRGDQRVRRELLCRGLAKDDVETALAVPGADSVDDRMRRSLDKKKNSFARLDARTAERRAFGALARQGFDADDIRRLLRTYFKGDDNGEDL